MILRFYDLCLCFLAQLALPSFWPISVKLASSFTACGLMVVLVVHYEIYENILPLPNFDPCYTPVRWFKNMYAYDG